MSYCRVYQLAIDQGTIAGIKANMMLQRQTKSELTIKTSIII